MFSLFFESLRLSSCNTHLDTYSYNPSYLYLTISQVLSFPLYYELLKDIYSLLPQMIFCVHSMPHFYFFVHLFVFCLIFRVQIVKNPIPTHRSLPVWDKGTKDYKTKAERRHLTHIKASKQMTRRSNKWIALKNKQE